MKVLRCRVCGEVYIGEEKPKSCPFCGAHENYFVLAREWRLLQSQALSDVTKENLKKALDLEIDNTNFYKAVSEKSKDVYVSSMFKGLSKVEREHTSAICRHLGIQKPDSQVGLNKAVDPSINASTLLSTVRSTVSESNGSGSTLSEVERVDSDKANIEESNRRERRAVKFYGEAMNQAPEQDIKEFFRALMEIESDHIVLTEQK